jgi:hypothetical protein
MRRANLEEDVVLERHEEYIAKHPLPLGHQLVVVTAVITCE